MPSLIPTSDLQDSNLWIAAGEGKLELVQYYLESQSLDVNAKDEFEYTALHAAVSYSQIDIIRFLISKGADVNIRDGDMDTPLHVVESEEIARLLIEHGADPKLRNDQGFLVCLFYTDVVCLYWNFSLLKLHIIKDLLLLKTI